MQSNDMGAFDRTTSCGYFVCVPDGTFVSFVTTRLFIIFLLLFAIAIEDDGV